MIRLLLLLMLLLTFCLTGPSRARSGATILVWGGPLVEEATRLAIDSDGHIYVMGIFRGGEEPQEVDFDPGPRSDLHMPGDLNSFFVSKVDSTGNHLWCQTWNSRSYIYWGDVGCDRLGNVYIIGNFKESIDLDPGPATHMASSPSGETKGFLVKLTPDGNFMWGKSLEAVVSALAIDGSDNVLLTGTTSLNFAGSGAIYVCKANHDGTIEWSHIYGNQEWNSLGQTRGVAIGAGEHGNEVYLLGSFDGTEDLDPGEGIETLTAESSRNGYFLSRFDSSGRMEWVRSWAVEERTSWFFPTALALEDDVGLFITGYLADGAVDFDPGEGVEIRSSEEGRPVFYLLKLDSSGNYIFVRIFTPIKPYKDFSPMCFPNALAFDRGGTVYIGGLVVCGSFDFDPGEGESIHEAELWGDGYVVSLDSEDGRFIDLYVADGSETSVEDVAVSPEGNLCIVGSFEGDVIFDLGEEVSSVYSSAGYEDCFLIILPNNSD